MPLEVAHLGAVLLLLAQVVRVEWLVLLLEHLQVGLVITLELSILILLLLSGHGVLPVLVVEVLLIHGDSDSYNIFYLFII